MSDFRFTIDDLESASLLANKQEQAPALHT